MWFGFRHVFALMVFPMSLQAAEDGYADKFRLLDERGAGSQIQAQEALPASIRSATGYPSARYQGDYNGPYLALARGIAKLHGLPGDLFTRLIDQESSWNPRAVSPKGAIGLGQLMPLTARELGVDPRDPRQNLDGSARYLKRQYESFGTWRLALAAYNAGPDAVLRYGGVPPFAETQAYVVAVYGE